MWHSHGIFRLNLFHCEGWRGDGPDSGSLYCQSWWSGSKNRSSRAPDKGGKTMVTGTLSDQFWSISPLSLFPKAILGCTMMHHTLGDIHQPIINPSSSHIQTWLPGAEKIFYDIYKQLPANVKKKPDAHVAAECHREALRLYPGRNGQQRWQRSTEAMLKKLPVLKERQGAVVGSREWRLSGAG